MAGRLDVSDNRFLASLSRADLDLIASALVEARFERGQVLREPSEAIDTIYFPVSAILAAVTHMENGQMVESLAIGRETAHGLLNALGARASCHRVIVQVAGAGFAVPEHRLREAAAASPSFNELVVRHVQLQFVQTEQSVACNALHQVEARLCRWLLMCQDRVVGRSLPLTQEFLGHMLGVQRTTVTAVASALQSAGLIRYSRGLIEILDRPGLENGACECYAAVRQRIAAILEPGGGH